MRSQDSAETTTRPPVASEGSGVPRTVPSTVRLHLYVSLPEIGDYTVPVIFDNKKFGLLKSALNRSAVQFWQFSHKLWILKLSLVKIRSPELQKNGPSIRAAQKFDLDLGDIFVKSFRNVQFS